MTTDSADAGGSARAHKDYYTALYSAALAFSSSLELKEVLQNVVTNVTETMHVKACSLAPLRCAYRAVRPAGCAWVER